MAMLRVIDRNSKLYVKSLQELTKSRFRENSVKKNNKKINKKFMRKN